MTYDEWDKSKWRTGKDADYAVRELINNNNWEPFKKLCFESAYNAGYNDATDLIRGKDFNGCNSNACIIKKPKVGTNTLTCYCSQAKVQLFVSKLKKQLQESMGWVAYNQFMDSL